MPPPTAKDNWIAQFQTRLQQLRPELGARRFSAVIANREWAEQKGVDPHVAAERWVAKSARPKP